MSLQASASSIKDALASYLAWLKEIDEDEFVQSPPGGGWSYSEVFCHVIQVNVRSMLAAERCIYAKFGHRTSGPNLIARLILYMGKFPPLKIKAHAKVVSIVKPVTKEEARNDMLVFCNKLQDLLPKLMKVPAHQRTRHARLGMLNCEEWLKFIDIHTRHHLKQLERIRKSS
ncbi:DinB family protein [Arcticibacter pallidicorallinus]|uniref:DinB family protein n=1 Tax=Arcticibacter pallidicorallinus TaxID=1259464 RepID=A0A2T0TU09_9SPHI|nr:DinB family protein [Arcticibacter pallidicorallinus]PRY49130.1 DinB family protein [Arcticibacter pallidicorallinus]